MVNILDLFSWAGCIALALLPWFWLGRNNRPRMIAHINRANLLIAELYQHLGAQNYYLRLKKRPPFSEEETMKLMDKCIAVNDEGSEWSKDEEA